MLACTYVNMYGQFVCQFACSFASISYVRASFPLYVDNDLDDNCAAAIASIIRDAHSIASITVHRNEFTSASKPGLARAVASSMSLREIKSVPFVPLVSSVQQC